MHLPSNQQTYQKLIGTFMNMLFLFHYGKTGKVKTRDFISVYENDSVYINQMFLTSNYL